MIAHSLVSPYQVPPHRSLWAVPVSVLAHALLGVALVASVAWKTTSPTPPPAQQAELWDALPSAAPPPAPTVSEPVAEVIKPIAPPVTKAAPEPEPKPDKAAISSKKPVLKKSAVADEKDEDETPPVKPKIKKPEIKKPEPKPEPKPDLKAAQKPSNKPVPAPEPEAPALIRAEREAQRAKQLDRLNGLSNANATSSTGSGGAPNLGRAQAGAPTGFESSYGAKLAACVTPNVNFSTIGLARTLRVEITVQLSPAGKPTGATASGRSGNDSFDAAVLRAVERCSPDRKSVV